MLILKHFKEFMAKIAIIPSKIV